MGRSTSDRARCGTPRTGQRAGLDRRRARPMTFRIVLLRHGQTEWNARERYQGQTDVPLNETGVVQAKEAAERWLGTDFLAVRSSPLMRARTTAEYVLQARGVRRPVSQIVTVDARLAETAGGQWESLYFSEIATQWPEEFAQWRRPDINCGPVQGETPKESGTRSAQAIRETLSGVLPKLGHNGASATVLFVAHGNTLRAATHVLLGQPDSHYGSIPRLDNCRAHILTYTPGASREFQLIDANV
ncbi:histidine phosphatase family protein [Auritidibacter ignavus]|nr:histidine phosphatase family protein [Auritidibacter sp. NML130574]RMX24018.1 histidine phosphatase family protein [Auritidibacter ignavus]